MNQKSDQEEDAIAESIRRPGPKLKATRDRFDEAVKIIEGRGERLSVEGLRLIIGGYPGTVGRMLLELIEERVAFASAVPFPADLTKALKSYADDSIAEVTKTWNQRYEEILAVCLALQTATSQLERANKDLQEDAEQLRNERQQEAGRYARQSEELNSQKQEIATLRNQLFGAELRVGRADDERDAAIKRLDGQELASIKTKESLDQHREVVADLREELGVTKTHLEHARAQIKSLEARSVQLPIKEQRAGSPQPPIRELEARSRQQTIKALQAIPRADIDPAVFSDDDSVPLG